MAALPTNPLVSPAWLAGELTKKKEGSPQNPDPGLIILDASWFMPGTGRSGASEFASGPRIPGSRFFDIDAIADKSTGLPHMLPQAGAFAAAADALGIASPATPVLLYDRAGIFSAPRAWYTFLAMGHDPQAVAVLDGGLPAYESAGAPLETGPADAAALAAPGQAAAAAAAGGAAPPSSSYTATPRPAMVRDLAAILKAVQAAPFPLTLVDARPAGRFAGTAPEPRAGLQSGHIPGAVSLPFGELLEGGRYKEREALAAVFADKAGVVKGAGASSASSPPLAFTCGTGVTACILALGATAAGLVGEGGTAFSVYDGSWTEWAGVEGTPKEPAGGGVLAE